VTIKRLEMENAMMKLTLRPATLMEETVVQAGAIITIVFCAIAMKLE
jgi:hypothetical protein